MIEYLVNQLKNNNISYTNEKIEKLLLFNQILYEENKKYNLTGIYGTEDIVNKHYVDSLQVINVYDMQNKNIVDVGTGAGFPGIPLAIFIDNSEFLLMDSLLKRIKFIDYVINELKLKNVRAIHSRAEDAGRNEIYREKFDIAISRAVGDFKLLSEYLLPLVKIGGVSIAYKANIKNDELDDLKNSSRILGSKSYSIVNSPIKGTDISRNFVIINKDFKTPRVYPRNSNLIIKKPLK